jgi:CRP-like cAMP-binding protein
MIGFNEQLSLFRDFGPGQLALLKSMFLPDHAPTGTVLFGQGDPANYLYLLLSGEIHLYYKPEDGAEILIAKIKPESVVGWSAALGNPVYTSSAVCVMDCQMLRVHGRDLHLLCEQYPEIGEIILDRLATMIADRWRKAHPDVMTLLEQSMHSETNK